MKLTDHFTLAEFTVSNTGERLGIDNTPNSAALRANITRTAQLLERIRELLGAPVIITSGYRCPQINAHQGGAMTRADLEYVMAYSRVEEVVFVCQKRLREGNYSGANSAHMEGLAADIIVPGFGVPYDVCRAIEQNLGEFGIDQLIYEHTWCHVGLRDGAPRHQVLTLAKGGGYVNGIVLRGGL
jgi:zinc D-Ala-D-Ala carboxypeptidase